MASILDHAEPALPLAPHEMIEADVWVLGPALRRAREAEGLTREAVADRTRIGIRFIAALEESRLEEFTSSIHAIGFARAFARAVGVAEDWAADVVREKIRAREPRWRRSGWIA